MSAARWRFTMELIADVSGFVSLDLVKEDEARNGLDTMLDDVATAKNNGIRFTAEAALYVLNAVVRGAYSK